MGMRPDLLRLQIMQDMERMNQGQPVTSDGPVPGPHFDAPHINPIQNPIEAGANTGIQSARRSLQMNEGENRQALGRALMAFAASMANNKEPNYGFAGNLNAMNQSFWPAVQAYDQERNRISDENMKLMQMEEQKRYHDIIGGRIDKEERERRRWEEAEKDLPQGVEFIEKYRSKPSEWKTVEQDIKNSHERGEQAREIINTITELRKVVHDSPDLYNKLDFIILNADNKDPSFWTRFARKGIPKKDIKNFEIAKSLMTKLHAMNTHSVTARAINKYMETQLKRQLPDISQAPEAFDAISEQGLKAAYEDYNLSEEKDKLVRQGLWKRDELKPLRKLDKEEKKSVKDLSDEELNRLIAEEEGQQNLGALE